MKQLLPAGATKASLRRARIARQMVESCPETWRVEIALTGSASRGVADAGSDIELNFWCHDLPTPQEREAWLTEAGATDVALGVEITPDATTWDRWRSRDVWVEAGWQSISVLEANLQRILAGDTIEHANLVLAEVVSHAITLRGKGGLSSWQDSLAHYPDILQQRLIDSVLEQWVSPYTAITRWLPVRRDQPLALAKELVSDVQGVLRILFALNREWEPDWKWISALAERLQRKPDQLIERIAACFEQAPPSERMRTCTQLILDTISLLPHSQKLDAARHNLQLGLDLGAHSAPSSPMPTPEQSM